MEIVDAPKVNQSPNLREPEIRHSNCAVAVADEQDVRVKTAARLEDPPL